jgi:hypothetical protein
LPLIAPPRSKTHSHNFVLMQETAPSVSAAQRGGCTPSAAKAEEGVNMKRQARRKRRMVAARNRRL